MLNRRRNGIQSMLARGILVMLLGMTIACGGTSVAGPTPAPVTPVPAVPSPSGAYAVTASTNVVVSGGQFSVTWTTSVPYAEDWIVLSKVGGPNVPQVWAKSTDAATSGTFTLSAPTEPGQYEFRYLLEDFSVAARSSPVTVGGGPAPTDHRRRQ
jgi:hypothetical protein